MITLAVSERNQLEIYPTIQFKQPAFPEQELFVVGITKGYDEAVELVFQDMENRMKTVMGTKVNISRKDKSKGKIEIEYYSEAELERLVELIESIQPV